MFGWRSIDIVVEGEAIEGSGIAYLFYVVRGVCLVEIRDIWKALGTHLVLAWLEECSRAKNSRAPAGEEPGMVPEEGLTSLPQTPRETAD